MLRSQASDRLSAALGEGLGRLDRDGQRELGRAIILELLQAEAAARIVGRASEPGRAVEQDGWPRAVFDALFGLGRLQPLVDDDRVENIIITGHDTVRLELTDGADRARRPGRRQRSGADRLPGLPGLARRR